MQVEKGVTSFYRRFDFFESEKLADSTEEQKLPIPDKKAPAANAAQSLSETGGLNFFDDFDAVCASSGRGALCFGDKNGKIMIINRDLQLETFASHTHRIHKLFKTKDSDLLIALGKEEEIPNAMEESTIKIWALSNIDTMGKPTNVKTFRVFPDSIENSPITTLTATRNGSQIAVGCANGVVVLFDVNTRQKQPRPITLCKQGNAAVTGLHYREDGDRTLLYVITLENIAAFVTGSRKFPHVTLDSDGGCHLDCSVLDSNRQLVVAKSETIHLFEGSEKRGIHAFPGGKKMIRSFRRYLIVVCSGSQSGPKLRNSNRVEVTIYDNSNKYIAFRRTFDDLIDIVGEWGSVFILTRTQLLKLRDKDLQEKLNEFFRYNLYQKAIDLARSEGEDNAKIMEYYRDYGDFLYNKGDYEQAMEQYLQTIDKDSTIQPSYVIRKFLDAQKTESLTHYLAALHERGTPTPDHTTLLLNCYTKLNLPEKLDQFINPHKDASGHMTHNPKFDIDTAIRVCREAQLLKHAKTLAKNNDKHEIYLDILLEESQDTPSNKHIVEALTYIKQLPFLEAEANMKRIGQTLIAKEPKQATELVTLLCTDWPQNAKDEKESSGREDMGSVRRRVRAEPEHFIHLFVQQRGYLRAFLELLEKEGSGGKLSTAIYNTLLEIYMRDAFQLRCKGMLSAEQNLEIQSIETAVMRLLANRSLMYDETHVLALAKMYRMESAVIFLYEQMHLYHEVVQFYKERNDYKKILDTCAQFNERDPSLWTHAFTYFIHQNGCDEHIKECLRQISRHHLFPPLMIIELLANTDITLDVIRDYIIKDLETQQMQIAADEKQIDNSRNEIASMAKQIDQLTTTAKTFQATKCIACLAPLELPTIHFLCGHSLHKRCLFSEAEVKCPKCVEDHDQVRSRQEGMQRSRDDHDQFFGQLHTEQKEGDAFKTVAEYFGRGVIH